MSAAAARPVRFGILGAGRVVVGRYLSVFDREVTGAEVVAVCDTVPERAQHAANVLKTRAMTSMEAFLADPAIEVVVVATESGHHDVHAMAALRAGKHVVVEKPPAMIPAGVDECRRFAEASGLMYAVVFQNRLNPAMRVLKRAFDEGRFGRFVLGTIRLRWCRVQDYYEDGWHGTWRMDGGVINQQAIHHVDALRWVCGEVAEVSALRANALNKLEAEDTMLAVLRFAHGGSGAIEATTAIRPRDVEASISVFGEDGMAVVGGIALNRIDTWEFSTQRPEDARIQDHSQDVPNGYGLSHKDYIQMVIDRLAAGDITPPIGGAETIGTVALVHALYASTEQGGPVRLADNPVSRRLGVG